MPRYKEDLIKPKPKHKHGRAKERRRTNARIASFVGGQDEFAGQDKPGAGGNARSGLKKPKPDPDDEYAGYADIFEQRKPSWQMDRGEFLEKVRSERERRRGREAWLAEYREKVIARRIIEPVDQKDFIGRLAPQALDELKRVLGKSLSCLEGTEAGIGFAKKILASQSPEFKIYNSIAWGNAEDRLEVFLGAYISAGKCLEKKDWARALELFSGAITIYLSDNHGLIPHPIGLGSLELSRIIARAWAGAAAAEYAGIDVEGYLDILGGGGFQGEKVFYPGRAVAELGRVGRLEDLPLIAKIGMGCCEFNLEIRCKSSQDFIRISEAIRLVLPKMTEADKEHFGLPGYMSEPQLIRKLAWLLYSLNLGEMLAEHGALRQFGRGYTANPYFAFKKQMKIHSLLSDKLDQDLRFISGEMGTMMAHMLDEEAKTIPPFLMDAGLAKEKKKEKEERCGGCRDCDCRQLRLTEKGKELVSGLMHEIMKIDIIYTGKVSSRLPESHRVSPEEFRSPSPDAIRIAGPRLLKR